MNTSSICRLPMTWNQLSCFWYRHGHKIQTISVDEFCFLNAIELVLYCDYDEVVTCDDIVNNIIEHLATNANCYKGFHNGDLVQTAEHYFKFGNYCDYIINVLIIATVKALHLNLSIYQKGQMESNKQ